MPNLSLVVKVAAGLLLVVLVPVGAWASPNLVIGQRLFDSGQFQSSRDLAFQALQTREASDTAGWRVLLLRSLLRLDDWFEASVQGMVAVKANPGNADLHGLLALAQFRGGQPELSEFEAKASVALNPNDYWGLLARGRCLMWDNRYPEARLALRSAIHERPNDPDGWLQLIIAYSASKPQFVDSLGVAVATYESLKPRGHPHDVSRDQIEASWQAFERVRSYYVKHPAFQVVSPVSGKELAVLDHENTLLEITAPIELVGGQVAVPVMLDRQRLKLLLDTGSPSIILTHGAASRLGKKAVASIVVWGAHGRELQQQYRADTLQLGSFESTTIPFNTSSIALSGFDGVLGASTLGRFVITLDLKKLTITLSRGKLAALKVGPQDNGVVMQFHSLPGSSDIHIPFTVAGTRSWAFFDSGASGVLFSLNAIGKMEVGVSQSSIVQQSISSRSYFGANHAASTIIAIQEPSHVTFGDAPSQFTLNMPYAAGLSNVDSDLNPAQDFEDELLAGMPATSGYGRIVIDYPHRLIGFFDPVAPESPAPAQQSSQTGEHGP